MDAHRRHRGAARRRMDREQPLEIGPRLDQSSLDLAAQLVDHEPTPAAEATWRELERRFHAAAEQLDEQDREVVLMRHFEQLSNSEAALALKLSPPAASMRYLRAMRRLRELIGPDESSEAIGNDGGGKDAARNDAAAHDGDGHDGAAA